MGKGWEISDKLIWIKKTHPHSPIDGLLVLIWSPSWSSLSSSRAPFVSVCVEGVASERSLLGIREVAEERSRKGYCWAREGVLCARNFCGGS
jgi:hypothetical protein